MHGYPLLLAYAVLDAKHLLLISSGGRDSQGTPQAAKNTTAAGGTCD